MNVVVQRYRERVLYGTQTTDAEGFAINCWTLDPTQATQFSDFMDAEDDANERFMRGQFLAGYTLDVEEL